MNMKWRGASGEVGMSDEMQEGISARKWLRGWDLLKTRDFGFLFAGQLISQIGDSLNKVALLWFVYDLTGSALKMTVVGLLQTLPPLLFGPLIGVYLDRLKKKPVMITVDVIRTVMILLIPLLYLLEALTLDRLYVLVFVTSIVSTVFGPALASAVPLIAPKDRLTAANALMQSTTNVGLLVGPAISGIGIALMGAQNVLYVDAATFFLSALCLIPIRINEPQTALPAKGWTDGVTQDLVAGFRFVFLEQKTIFALMLTAALYSLGVSAFVFLLPVFAKDILGMGPIQLGWLWSSLGNRDVGRILLPGIDQARGYAPPSTADLRRIGRRRDGRRHTRFFPCSARGCRFDCGHRREHRAVYAAYLGDAPGVDAGAPSRPGLYQFCDGRDGVVDGRDGRVRLGCRCHRPRCQSRGNQRDSLGDCRSSRHVQPR
jgi:hypothetical protein